MLVVGQADGFRGTAPQKIEEIPRFSDSQRVFCVNTVVMNNSNNNKPLAIAGIFVLAVGTMNVEHVNPQMLLEVGDEDRKVQVDYLGVASGCAQLALSADGMPPIISGHYQPS